MKPGVSQDDWQGKSAHLLRHHEERRCFQSFAWPRRNLAPEMGRVQWAAGVGTNRPAKTCVASLSQLRCREDRMARRSDGWIPPIPLFFVSIRVKGLRPRQIDKY